MKQIVATCLLLLGALAVVTGCATSSTFRGDVEFGRLRVLTEVDTLPQLAIVPDLEYPEVLLAQGTEGTAEITYTVNTFGATTDITVKAASDPAFGEAATRVVRRLRYVPARKGISRVPCTVEITFFYRIR